VIRDFPVKDSPTLREQADAWQRDSTQSATPRPAATVMFVRDAPAGVEVFMLRRVASMAFAPRMMAFPGGGAYHASKHAVEALSDALRFEMAGMGIDVVVIEPGLVRSHFAAAAVASLDGAAGPAGTYAAFNQAVARITRDAYVKGPFARLAGEPEDVARVIARAMRARRPRARYRVTPSGHLMLLWRWLLCDGLWDRFLAMLYPRPSA
jgi:NAD(P)-dependent dehydrogenase (short-subunit alcohol dehydrogenase family)